MPDLSFQVEGAEPVPYAATPLLALRLRVSSMPPHEPVHSAVLKCQIPITLLFSGTVFYAGAQGCLQVSPVPWSKQARYALPVSVWKDVIDLSFPNAGFVTLHRDVLDRLYHYRVKRGFATWERAVESLLAPAEADA